MTRNTIRQESVVSEVCHKRPSQGNLLFKTCFERYSFGVANGDQVSLDPPTKSPYIVVLFYWKIIPVLKYS